jgi:hypothetical protein
MQVAYLKTHPAVAGAIARRQLTMSGWDYDIGAAEIRISDDGEALKGPCGFDELHTAVSHGVIAGIERKR